MNRRGALAIFGGTLVGEVLGTRARAATVRRIGMLLPGTLTPAEIQQTLAPLRALGWIEGQNLVVEVRMAGGNSKLLRQYAEDLVRLNVELIGTLGPDATIAAKNATTVIPIVLIGAGDPVRAGFVASLAKPGGNITGFSTIGPELIAKSLGLLRELLPSAQRIVVLVDSSSKPYDETFREERERLYRSFGMQRIVIAVAAASELESAVAEAVQQRAQVLTFGNDALFWMNRILPMRAALQHKLPTLVPARAFVEAGGLLSLRYDDVEQDRVFAYFTDRILRGAKPADLPVQQPTKFELVINLKTAKTLGLTIPQSLLLRADEVIQ